MPLAAACCTNSSCVQCVDDGLQGVRAIGFNLHWMQQNRPPVRQVNGWLLERVSIRHYMMPCERLQSESGYPSIRLSSKDWNVSLRGTSLRYCKRRRPIQRVFGPVRARPGLILYQPQIKMAYFATRCAREARPSGKDTLKPDNNR